MNRVFGYITCNVFNPLQALIERAKCEFNKTLFLNINKNRIMKSKVLLANENALMSKYICYT